MNHSKFHPNRPDVEKLSSALRTKIWHYWQEHENFKKSVLESNFSEISHYLNKAIPSTSRHFFNEDDFFEMGDSLADDLDDVDYQIHDLFKNIPNLSKSQKLLDLMAPELILKDQFFMMVYFSHTQNFPQALNHANTLLNYKPWHDNAMSCITSVIKNPSHDFFKSFHQLFIQSNLDKEIVYRHQFPLSLSSQFIEKPHHPQSWIDYYQFYFPHWVDNQLRTQNIDSDRQLAIKNIFANILGITLLSTKNIVEPPMAYEIKNFLTQEYKKHFNISEMDFILIDLIYHQNQRRNNHKTLQKSPRYSSRLTQLYDKNLTQFVSNIIENHDPYLCLEKFKSIGIPFEYYQELERFIQLDTKIDDKPASTICSLKKI